MERDKRLEVRVSATEFADIQQRAAAADRTVSDYVRVAALGKPLAVQRFERIDPADLAQIKRVGNLLNQIATAMHTRRAESGTFLLLDSVLADIKKLVRRQLDLAPGSRRSCR